MAGGIEPIGNLRGKVNSSNALVVTLDGGSAAATTFVGPAADNTAAVPFTFTGDTNTGLASSAADTLNLVTGGTSRVVVNATAVTIAGQLGINGALGTEDRLVVRAGANDFGIGVVTGAGLNPIVGLSMKNSASGFVYVKDAAAGSVVASLDGVTGNITFAGALIGSGIQPLSGAGAVNVTQNSTAYTSTGVAQALTLANGDAGQLKYIVHVVDGGSGVLTPTTKIGFTTITFTNVGEGVTLLYTAQGWAIVGIFGAVAA